MKHRMVIPLKYVSSKEFSIMNKLPEVRIDELANFISNMDKSSASNFVLVIPKHSTVGRAVAEHLKRNTVSAPGFKDEIDGIPHTAMDGETHLGDGKYVRVMENGQWSEPYTKPEAPTTASMLLGQARELLDQRARDYDKPEGERSMGKVAQLFNLATDRTGDRAVSESEAWLVMALLKIVRDRSTPHGHKDSLEDLVSYSALYGESRHAEMSVIEKLKQFVTPDTDGLAPHAARRFKVMPAKEAPETKVEANAATRSELGAELSRIKQRYGRKAAKELLRVYGKCTRLCELTDDNAQALANAIRIYYGNEDLAPTSETMEVQGHVIGELARKLMYVYREAVGTDTTLGKIRGISGTDVAKFADLNPSQKMALLILMIGDMYARHMETF